MQNFGFLEDVMQQLNDKKEVNILAFLYKQCEKAEEHINDNTGLSIFFIGRALELMVSKIYMSSIENVKNAPFNYTLSDKINFIKLNNNDHEIFETMNRLRKKRNNIIHIKNQFIVGKNDKAHEEFDDDEKILLLKDVFDISSYFVARIYNYNNTLEFHKPELNGNNESQNRLEIVRELISWKENDELSYIQLCEEMSYIVEKNDVINIKLEDLKKEEEQILYEISKSTELVNNINKKAGIIIKIALAIIAVFIIAGGYLFVNKINVIKGKISINISSPSAIFIQENSDIEYILSYPTDKKIEKIELKSSDISTFGFNANVEIISTEGNDRIIKLSNIVKSNNQEKLAYIGVKSETAYDIDGNTVSGIEKSPAFIIGDKNASSDVPNVSISGPSKSFVGAGGTVDFIISFGENDIFQIETSDIGVAGDNVTCHKEIIIPENDNNSRIVRLSDVQGDVGKMVSIAVKGGVAANQKGVSVETQKSIAFLIMEQDYVRPSISLSYPSITSVASGGTLSYDVFYADNIALFNVSLDNLDIECNGFTAEIEISEMSFDKRKITLKNIKRNSNYNNTANIGIKAFTAEDYCSNKALGVLKSEGFIINN